MIRYLNRHTRSIAMQEELNFVDNSDEVARKSHQRYCIEGLAETLLPILIKAKLNKEDTEKAVVRAVKELFR